MNFELKKIIILKYLVLKTSELKAYIKLNIEKQFYIFYYL